jgi:hypothetical protein
MEGRTCEEPETGLIDGWPTYEGSVKRVVKKR